VPRVIYDNHCCAIGHWVLVSHEQGIWKLGISVLEVTTIEPVLEQAENILTEMRMFKYEKGWQYDDDYNRTANIRSERLDFFFVFVVDVVAQQGYLLVCGERELELAQIAFPDGQLSAACEGIAPPGKTLSAEQTLMNVGNRVSRKKEYAPPLMEACDAFKRSKDPTTGAVDDAQEEEDASLDGVEVKYKQGGEQLEIDYDIFKKGFNEVGRQHLAGVAACMQDSLSLDDLRLSCLKYAVGQSSAV
jgi:hypothetical protein